MEKEIAISIQNVSKSFFIPHERRTMLRERLMNFRKKMTYETFHALEDLSFEIHKGEFFSIIGRNGSGKSTLLKIMGGIYSPDKGKVKVYGEISPFLELGVGFNPELSGKDNIYLNSTILGLSKREIDNKFKSIVEFSELEKFIDLKLKNYSSGMQVRLAFATAIQTNRDILLMDEVLAVGDKSFQLKCYQVFEKLIKSGKTIVFVSHDPGPIQKYSNRVLYLEQSRMAFLGAPSEALSKYIACDEGKARETPVTEDNAILT
jgi:ABC-2 type transport system ATP-binding protein